MPCKISFSKLPLVFLWLRLISLKTLRFLKFLGDCLVSNAFRLNWLIVEVTC